MSENEDSSVDLAISFFAAMLLKTFYQSIQQMQQDLDAYLVTYNTKRPHQGRGMKGRTPIQAFRDGLKLVPKPDLSQEKKGGENEPQTDRLIKPTSGSDCQANTVFVHTDGQSLPLRQPVASAPGKPPVPVPNPVLSSWYTSPTSKSRRQPMNHFEIKSGIPKLIPGSTRPDGLGLSHSHLRIAIVRAPFPFMFRASTSAQNSIHLRNT
ncbi:hypothetical protein [Hoeflea sp.]|uniref:hypothetical protein n=1 Tax=Hoeflea sp. TaxID=1940281 RepID=UPI00374A8785